MSGLGGGLGISPGARGAEALLLQAVTLFTLRERKGLLNGRAGQEHNWLFVLWCGILETKLNPPILAEDEHMEKQNDRIENTGYEDTGLLWWKFTAAEGLPRDVAEGIPPGQQHQGSVWHRATQGPVRRDLESHRKQHHHRLGNQLGTRPGNPHRAEPGLFFLVCAGRVGPCGKIRGAFRQEAWR